MGASRFVSRARVSALVLAAAAFAADGRCADCPREASDAASQEGQRRLQAAQELAARGQAAEAESALREAVRLDPASPVPPYALGLALLERRAFVDAVAAFTQSREAFRCLQSDDPEALKRFVARLDEQLQQLRRTRAEYERNRLQRTIVKDQERNNEAPAPLGQSAMVVQALEARIGELQRLRQHPTREPAALALAIGNAQFNAGALEDAEREFRTAVVREPGNGDAHNNLAVTLTLLGRLDEAERELRAAEKAGVTPSPRIREEIEKRRRAATP